MRLFVTTSGDTVSDQSTLIWPFGGHMKRTPKPGYSTTHPAQKGSGPNRMEYTSWSEDLSGGVCRFMKWACRCLSVSMTTPDQKMSRRTCVDLLPSVWKCASPRWTYGSTEVCGLLPHTWKMPTTTPLEHPTKGHPHKKAKPLCGDPRSVLDRRSQRPGFLCLFLTRTFLARTLFAFFRAFFVTALFALDLTWAFGLACASFVAVAEKPNDWAFGEA
jgi:hypothetical protein